MWGRGALLAGLLSLIAPAAAGAAPPPGAVMSSNLEYVTRVADTEEVVEGKFARAGGTDVLVLTGRFGFKTFDVSDPANPVLLDTFMPPEIGSEDGYWQNEDMNLDRRRKLIIGALDPRHDDGRVDATCPRPGGSTMDPNCRSGFYVISFADPANLRQVGDFVRLPAGHTSTCIRSCKYIWTGGPARRADQDWLGPIRTFPRAIGNGRPIWVTDLRNPARPRVSELPIDLWRNDGYTDYSHDVNVDKRGVAWVSGRGGIRGYATKGVHRDPYTNRERRATPLQPILRAGGGVGGTSQPTGFMHNSLRPLKDSVDAAGVRKRDILIGTEEDFTEPCGESGRIVISNLSDSWGGEPAQRSSLDQPYRLQPLDTFHPAEDAADTTSGADVEGIECSAHYFGLAGSTLGAAFYSQGLRLIDVSDVRDLRQVGYFRVEGTSEDNPTSLSWDTAWRDNELIYLFDMARGVEILRLAGGAGASARMASVQAPAVGTPRFVSRRVGTQLVCPLFETPS
jgi:hypothetical protein